MSFNNFFAVFYHLFFLVWIVAMILVLVNYDVSGLEALGAGIITGALLKGSGDIVQFYFRKKSGGS